MKTEYRGPKFQELFAYGWGKEVELEDDLDGDDGLGEGVVEIEEHRIALPDR